MPPSWTKMTVLLSCYTNVSPSDCLTDCVLFADNSLSVHAFLCLFLANLCGCRLYLTNCPMSSTMSSKSGRNSISGEQDKTRQVDKRKSDDDDWRDSSADLILYIINSPRVSARGLNYSNCSSECFFVLSKHKSDWTRREWNMSIRKN